MECYLDNAATTRVDPEAAAVMQKIFMEDYGNPSSMHRKGFEAERIITAAKETFMGILKCGKKEILFTSGGTESNNTAIFGTALAHARQGKHILTTPVEHSAVSAPLKVLADQGFEVEKLSVDSAGRIDLSELEAKLRPDTILVSIMHVNNEIGTVEPVEAAGELIRRTVPGCTFHVDDIQGFGKLPLIPEKHGIDLLSVSSHKLHGPKGVGLLYISPRTRLSPLIYGGGQQGGMRSGTENVPGAAGFAKAAELIYKDLEGNRTKLSGLRDSFAAAAMEIPGVTVNGPAGERARGIDAADAAPHIISLSVRGVRAEVLLHALEDKGIYVSAGSACSSNRPHVSETLKAIGVPKEALDSTIRVSLSVHTKEEELRYCLEALREIIPALQLFRRK